VLTLPPEATLLYTYYGMRGSCGHHFVTSVTTRTEPLSVDEIYGHLLSHEMHLEQHQASLDLFVAGANFATRGNSSLHLLWHAWFLRSSPFWLWLLFW